MMNRKNILLLALANAENTGLSPVQLQKTLFLIGESLKPKKYYNFTPYSYGPFDSQIYLDAEDFSSQGLININYKKNEHYPNYVVSLKGSEKGKKLKSKSETKEVEFIQETVDFVKKLTFRQLLTVIYENYPQYSVNSVFNKQK